MQESPTPSERDLIIRARDATDIGVSLGAFARTQGLSYDQIKALLDRHNVRIEKRTRLALPSGFEENSGVI